MRFWGWAASLSRTAQFSLRWKEWGQSPQRGKVNRAAGSSTMGMSPQKHPKKRPGGFVTSLGAAESPSPRDSPVSWHRIPAVP